MTQETPNKPSIGHHLPPQPPIHTIFPIEAFISSCAGKGSRPKISAQQSVTVRTPDECRAGPASEACGAHRACGTVGGGLGPLAHPDSRRSLRGRRAHGHGLCVSPSLRPCDVRPGPRAPLQRGPRCPPRAMPQGRETAGVPSGPSPPHSLSLPFLTPSFPSDGSYSSCPPPRGHLAGPPKPGACEALPHVLRTCHCTSSACSLRDAWSVHKTISQVCITVT